MDILKNPIIIGLVFGCITYGYLLYTVNEKNKLNKHKHKYKKNKKIESVNLIIPLVVFLMSWFISYAYFEYNTNLKSNASPDNALLKLPSQLPLGLPPSPKFRFTKDVLSSSSDQKLESLLNSGINIPEKLPDVLLDIH
jgi:heme/copper-type cytochrome/quinol oxidase subunit 2